MRRPQFTLKTMLWLMACAACLFAGIGIEKERTRRAKAAAAIGVPMPIWHRRQAPLVGNGPYSPPASQPPSTATQD